MKWGATYENSRLVLIGCSEIPVVVKCKNDSHSDMFSRVSSALVLVPAGSSRRWRTWVFPTCAPVQKSHNKRDYIQPRERQIFVTRPCEAMWCQGALLSFWVVITGCSGYRSQLLAVKRYRYNTATQQWELPPEWEASLYRCLTHKANSGGVGDLVTT